MTRDALTRRLRAYYDATPAYHRAAARPARAEAVTWDPNHVVLNRYVHPGDRVLDLAGGNGAMQARLPERCQYTVADLSLEALRQGAREHPRGGGTVADARHLPFAAEQFDVVLCHHGLEHFPEPRLALGEATRVLRPGGHLILSGPCWDSPRQPLPMLAHRGPLAANALRARLLVRLLRNELRHHLGSFDYDPLVLDDVASFHGVGPDDLDYDAVHPTQLHETVFFLEGRGFTRVELMLWGDHYETGPTRRQRLLSRFPVVRWFAHNFPLVMRKLAASAPTTLDRGGSR